MKQNAGSFRGSCRLMAVTVALGCAGAVALDLNRGEADAQGLSLPSLTTPEVTVPSLQTPIGPTPQVTVPPISTPQVSVPAPTPRQPLPAPTVSVPPLKAPTVSVPQVRTPVASTPQVQTRPDAPISVSSPSAGLPGTNVRTPSVEPRAPSTQAPTGAGSGSGATTSPVGGAGGGSGSLPSPPQGGDATVAALALPHAAAVRDSSPARRRALLRRVWDEPLRGRHLRRLRAILREHAGCFDALPARGRRALSLRAGLGDRRPHSRRAIARRLDVPLERELSIEESSLRQLAACGVGGGAAAAMGGGTFPGTPAVVGGYRQVAASFTDRDSQPRDRGGVLGASRAGPVAVPVVDAPTGDNQPPDAVLLLALALLGPLAIALLAGRGRRTRRTGAPRE